MGGVTPYFQGLLKVTGENLKMTLYRYLMKGVQELCLEGQFRENNMSWAILGRELLRHKRLGSTTRKGVVGGAERDCCEL